MLREKRLCAADSSSAVTQVKKKVVVGMWVSWRSSSSIMSAAGGPVLYRCVVSGFIHILSLQSPVLTAHDIYTSCRFDSLKTFIN